MKIKYIELHYEKSVVSKYEDVVGKYELDHIKGNTKFYFTLHNKKYYYDCTTRSVFKKNLFFWVRQRNMKVEYAVFLGDEK